MEDEHEDPEKQPEADDAAKRNREALRDAESMMAHAEAVIDRSRNLRQLLAFQRVLRALKLRRPHDDPPPPPPVEH